MPNTHTIDNAAANEVGSHATTLTASTVETYTFSRRVAKAVLIQLSGAALIYYTTDGSVPTVGGVKTRVLPAVAGSYEVHFPHGTNSVLKVITAGTPIISVQRG